MATTQACLSPWMVCSIGVGRLLTTFDNKLNISNLASMGRLNDESKGFMFHNLVIYNCKCASHGTFFLFNLRRMLTQCISPLAIDIKLLKFVVAPEENSNILLFLQKKCAKETVTGVLD